MATFGFDRWFDMALESQAEVPFVVLVKDAGRVVSVPERRADAPAGRDRLDVA